ncbi:MAG: hypothetical protein SFV81_09420 [Pirellulaceae bacterium]|nr:hypothetical protein [Pirellulaceae bacterium]
MATIETNNNDANLPETQSPVRVELLVLAVDLAQLLVVGLVLDWLLFEGLEVLGVIRLGIVALLLVGMLKSQGWLVLFALQVSLLSREPGRPDMSLGLVPWLFSLTSIGIIAYAYLGKPLRSSISKWVVMQALFAFGLDDQSQATRSEAQATSPNWLQYVAVQFVMWMVVIFVSMLALLRLPISSSVRSEWLRSAIENDFIIWPGATLLVLALLMVIVFREVGWRQMTTAQASLYLRSSLVLDHYRDLRMIVLRQIKKNRKQTSTLVPQKQLIERTEVK